uniref:Uncharacterized protein n=1 Tax=Arundo donax TaxID=35708 RepID=A0A0A9HLC4_ARUDO
MMHSVGKVWESEAKLFPNRTRNYKSFQHTNSKYTKEKQIVRVVLPHYASKYT